MLPEACDILSSVTGGDPSPLAMLTSWNEVFEADITCMAHHSHLSAVACNATLHKLLQAVQHRAKHLVSFGGAYPLMQEVFAGMTQ